jgi:hypothetical protein
MKAELDRIRHDVKCGGKLGEKSAERLFNLLDQMIQRIEKLERKAGIE